MDCGDFSDCLCIDKSCNVAHQCLRETKDIVFKLLGLNGGFLSNDLFKSDTLIKMSNLSAVFYI